MAGALYGAGTVAGPVYRCVDVDGFTRFSDHTCVPGEQQTAVDVGARSGVADPAPASQREHLEQVLEALQRSREARSAERTQARERQAEAARARRRRVCGAATADADRIGNTPSGEFFRRDPDDPSTVRPLGRATARAELERLQSIIDENCD